MWRTAAWLTGLALTIGGLLPVGGVIERSRGFDEPDAAHRYYEARRIPSGSGGDVQALYARAMQQRERATHFSTRAESQLYRSWGVDVIGMTNLQEAKLAREAEIAYTTLALVTDFDCWHEEEGDVDVQKVLAVLRHNADLARRTVVETARLCAQVAPITAHGCMQHALITQQGAISMDARRRLQRLIGRYLG